MLACTICTAVPEGKRRINGTSTRSELLTFRCSLTLGRFSKNVLNLTHEGYRIQDLGSEMGCCYARSGFVVSTEAEAVVRTIRMKFDEYDAPLVVKELCKLT